MECYYSQSCQRLFTGGGISASQFALISIFSGSFGDFTAAKHLSFSTSRMPEIFMCLRGGEFEENMNQIVIILN